MWSSSDFAAAGGGDPPGHGGGGRGGGGGEGDGDENDDGLRLLQFRQLCAERGVDDALVSSEVLGAVRAGRLGPGDQASYLEVLCDPVLRFLSAANGFMRDRLIATPSLPRIALVETVVGLATMLSAEVKSRGDALRREMDFVACDLMLIVATNLALVLSLSPSAPVAPPPVSSFGRYMASLPATCFQQGAFDPGRRLACFGANLLRFGTIGVASSAVGATATKSLVCLRERCTGVQSDVHLAPVVSTSIAYGGFVATSSSTRYQLVNALEESVFPHLPVSPALLSLGLRTGNNFLGGVLWITWARWTGVQ